MEKLKFVIPFLLVLLTGACAGGAYHREIQVVSTGRLFGSESFAFCGGWVELWAQQSPQQGTRIFMKVSPASDERWVIWNPHVTVEHPKLEGYVLKKVENHRFDTGVEPTNVISWKLQLGDITPDAGFKVVLRPFEGCRSEQEARAVLLQVDA